ncbi:hypothetical protein EI94DRAFT_944170 [Lactarius quietus]|nr:hypothetical protein EI94DRAFT_944170 [Lactarius quietus]
MATARPVYNSVTRFLPPDSDLQANGQDMPIPSEASPLLRPKRTQWSTALSSFLENNTGLLLVAAAQFFFSAMGIAVKSLNRLDNPVLTLELILVRMVITYICSVTYMYWKRIPDPLLGPKDLRAVLVLRGLTGFVSLSGMYFSLQHLSLSDATVLTFIAPILTGFSGAVFLKEPLSIKETLAGLCSFVGVVLIARPEFLFGNHASSNPGEEQATPAERLTSVASERSRSLLGCLSHVIV